MIKTQHGTSQLRHYGLKPNYPLWAFLAVLMVYVAWASATPLQAAPPKFKLAASSNPIAAASASSASFGLNSCIDQSMAANSSSAKFKLSSGCGASYPVLLMPEGIPTTDQWALWLLMLSVLGLAFTYLRVDQARLA